MSLGRFKAVSKIAVIVGGVLGGPFLVCAAGGLRFNSWESLPPGVYIVTSDPNGLAEFCPAEPYARLAAERGYLDAGNCPNGRKPLLKPVVARAGDQVKVWSGGITVNGVLIPNTAPLSMDSRGRPLTAWKPGEYRVEEGQLWVAYQRS